MRGVQQLLMRFGILHAGPVQGRSRANRHGQLVAVDPGRGDRRRFADEIGFVDERKADEARGVVRRARACATTR